MVELHLSLKKVTVELHWGKKTGIGRTALGLKKVFPQNYHAFERVKRLENTHFLSHL